MDALRVYASALADAFLCGDSNQNSLKMRGQRCLGFSPIWLDNLCKEILQNKLLNCSEELVAFICNFEPLRSAWRNREFKHSIAFYYFPNQKNKSPARFINQSCVRLNHFSDLCDFLELDERRLLWLSDPWGSAHRYSRGALQHYIYRWIAKNNTKFSRLLEIPKASLKLVQRKINKDLLSMIPVHPDAHGFIKGRSTTSYTSAHLDKQWVLRLDLKHFFSSVSYTRVFNIFSSLGYPKNIVRQLSLLCTNRVPPGIMGKNITDWSVRKILMANHLPQGTPTSPALSNLAAYNLDCRLSAFATTIHSNYSRYADDILFSSDTYNNLSKVIPYIGYIVTDEGFQLNYRKTRVMSQGQRQLATGIVLNKHHNLPREDYEWLKAVLHNCICKGVKSQNKGHENFYAFLKGKLNYFSMLNPSKAKKLENMFKRIDWASSSPDTLS